MEAPGSGRRRLATAGLLAVSLVVALAAAELAARALRPEAASRIVYPCFYQEDARLGFRYRPGADGRVAGHFEIDNVARLNSLGFHDDEPLPPGRSAWRVLAVGDSFTAGLNLPRDEVWTAVLERELRARGHPTADVVNAGIDGTGTDVHLDLLEQLVPRLEPDTIVLAFYAGDLADVEYGRFRRECHRGYVLSYQDELQREVLRARVDASLERRALRAAFGRSYLVRLGAHALLGSHNLLRMNFAQVRLAELALGPAVRRARRASVPGIFEGLGAVARRCGCRLWVVPVPPRRLLTGSLRMLEARVGRERLARLGLPLLDIVPAIQRRLAADGRTPGDLYWVHDAHLNAYGNELFGRALADALLAGPEAPPRRNPPPRPPT